MSRSRFSFFVAVIPLLIFSGVFLAGCGGFGYGCGASVERAIEVTVLDAETGQPIADGATGTLWDGLFFERMQVISWISGATSEEIIPVALGGAFERKGTYVVRVEKHGYMAWEARNVKVERGPCHVTTRRLEARLKRLP